jgi:hypothetical protein
VFVGDRRSFQAYLAADGTVVSSSSWLSSQPAVAAVDAGGTMTALATGSATLTATVGGESVSALVTVTPEPRSLEDLKAHFPFGHARGRAQVYSDVGPEFSRQHGEHLALVYDAFARRFARSYGGAAVAYYTQDEALFRRVLAFCPTLVVEGGRSLTDCYDGLTGILSLFVVPYVIPDFGTQLHEFSHHFLYATWPASEDHPWFKEGTGMFWESGHFDAKGELVVTTPLPYLHDGIRRYRGSLLPLEQLVGLERREFYGHPEPVRVYAQAGMLVFYLMQRQPTAMDRAFAAINAGSIRTNEQLVSLILAESGLTLAELDRAYVAHALSF